MKAVCLSWWLRFFLCKGKYIDASRPAEGQTEDIVADVILPALVVEVLPDRSVARQRQVLLEAGCDDLADLVDRPASRQEGLDVCQDWG